MQFCPNKIKPLISEFNCRFSTILHGRKTILHFALPAPPQPHNLNPSPHLAELEAFLSSDASEGMRKMCFTTTGTEEIYQVILRDPLFEFLRR